MPFEKNRFSYRAGLNGTADKRNYSFLIGVLATPWPPMYKSLRRIPQFSPGDLNKKVISNALYGLPPFSLLALYRCPACQRAGFLHEKWRRSPVILEFSEHEHVLSGKMMARHLDWVHPTCGILRDLQAFFWLRVFPALRHFPSPPANH